MDIARPNAAKERHRRRLMLGVAAVLTIAGITLGLSRLEKAAPGVDKRSVLTDTVKRGEFVRQVRGNGSLVPEEIHWIPAMTGGRLDRILVLPGAAVTAETVLLELSNPEVEHAMFEAEWQVKETEAREAKLKVQLEGERLSQEAATAALRAEALIARLDADADAELAKDGLVDRLSAKRSKTKAEQLAIRSEIEERRLKILEESTRAQMEAAQAEVKRVRAVLDLRKQQVAHLKVRAGVDGVLQRLGELEMLRAGQQIFAGANLARIANPARLKAEIKIVETQAKDIQIGQKADVDTRNGIIAGRVLRIDPAVQNGTVTVDVSLEGALPKGARPDLSVEGTIELERLENVMYVGRPAYGQAEGTVGIFKLTNGGTGARRVPVKLGRASVSLVEVVAGLDVGDEVILSDMSQWDAHERLTIR